jgi:hypothetical protein
MLNGTVAKIIYLSFQLRKHAKKKEDLKSKAMNKALFLKLAVMSHIYILRSASVFLLEMHALCLFSTDTISAKNESLQQQMIHKRSLGRFTKVEGLSFLYSTCQRVTGSILCRHILGESNTAHHYTYKR